MSNIQSVMCPSVLWMSKPGNSVTALLQISLYFQTLFIWLYKAAERRKRRRKRTEGMGARDDEHYVGSVCACFQLTVHLIKTWNVLVVYSCCPSATVAKSSNMYLIFLCAMFFLFFLFFFFFLDVVHFHPTFKGGWGSPVASMTRTAFTHKVMDSYTLPVVLVMPQTQH